MSDVHVREANAGVSGLTETGGSAWTRTEVKYFEVTSDELLIAGK